jgi:hypothetical protein
LRWFFQCAGGRCVWHVCIETYKSLIERLPDFGDTVAGYHGSAYDLVELVNPRVHNRVFVFSQGARTLCNHQDIKQVFCALLGGFGVAHWFILSSTAITLAAAVRPAVLSARTQY